MPDAIKNMPGIGNNYTWKESAKISPSARAKNRSVNSPVDTYEPGSRIIDNEMMKVKKGLYKGNTGTPSEIWFG